MIAKVNEQPIFQDQLTPQVKAELKKTQKSLKLKYTPELEAQAQNTVLQRYINAELIHQASKNHPVDNLEERVTQILQKANKNKENTLDATSIKRQILINEYLKAHDLVSPKPSEETIRAFYEQGKDQFSSQQDRVHLQHIFVTKTNKEAILKAKKLLTNGQSFEEVAKAYSEDENTKDNAGDLGFIVRGYMPKEVEDVAFSLQKMTLSDIIETEGGYHLLKVLEINPAGTPIPYEKIKDFLARGLASTTKKEKVAAHLEILKSKAKIEIFAPKKSGS